MEVICWVGVSGWDVTGGATELKGMTGEPALTRCSNGSHQMVTRMVSWMPNPGQGRGIIRLMHSSWYLCLVVMASRPHPNALQCSLMHPNVPTHGDMHPSHGDHFCAWRLSEKLTCI